MADERKQAPIFFILHRALLVNCKRQIENKAT